MPPVLGGLVRISKKFFGVTPRKISEFSGIFSAGLFLPAPEEIEEEIFGIRFAYTLVEEPMDLGQWNFVFGSHNWINFGDLVGVWLGCYWEMIP